MFNFMKNCFILNGYLLWVRIKFSARCRGICFGTLIWAKILVLFVFDKTHSEVEIDTSFLSWPILLKNLIWRESGCESQCNQLLHLTHTQIEFSELFWRAIACLVLFWPSTHFIVKFTKSLAYHSCARWPWAKDWLLDHKWVLIPHSSERDSGFQLSSSLIIDYHILFYIFLSAFSCFYMPLVRKFHVSSLISSSFLQISVKVQEYTDILIQYYLPLERRACISK